MTQITITEIKKWPKFSGEKVEILKRLFLTGESMNLENFVKFFTDDALYQFGNSPIVYGPEGIKEPSLDFLKKVEGVHHHIKNIWEVADNQLVVEMEVTYIRHDGKVFTLPCCDIIRLNSNKVQTMQIFMDISPVYNTPETSPESERRELLSYLKNEKTSMTAQLSTSKLDIIERMQGAVSEGNWDVFKSCLTNDIFYKVGNVVEVTEPQAIVNYLIQLAKSEIAIINRVPRGSWELGDVAIVEYDMQGTLVSNNQLIDYPCVDTYRFKGNQIYEWRVYPAFAGSNY